MSEKDTVEEVELVPCTASPLSDVSFVELEPLPPGPVPSVLAVLKEELRVVEAALLPHEAPQGAEGTPYGSLTLLARCGGVGAPLLVVLLTKYQVGAETLGSQHPTIGGVTGTRLKVEVDVRVEAVLANGVGSHRT